MKMQLAIRYLILLLIISAPFLDTYGQKEPVQITISKEKTIVDGKTYYLHTVKPGETLFSLSKAYNVPQKEIINLNKDAATSLKIGQILRIPSSTPLNVPSSLDSENYIFHIVEAGQTVVSIAEKYSLTKEDIYKHNPETEISPLQSGQVIKIPKDLKSTAKISDKSATYTEHKVKRKETLFSISRTYQVSVDDIIALNPELNTSDIKTGQTLKIPAAKSGSPAVATEDADKSETKVTTFEPCAPTEDKKVHKVAFLLPLFLDENQTIQDIDSVSGNKSIEDRLIFNRSRYPLEFYEGALLAIDSLKKAGHSFKINVYDTGRDIQKLTNILKDKELTEMELFIGPFDTMLIEKALVFAKTHNIKVVSPLSQNMNLLRGNPLLYQVNPSENSKIDAAIQYLATQKDKNIVLFKSNRAADSEISNLFENKLNSLKGEGFQFKVHSGNTDANFMAKLVPDKENLIIMPSNEETAVADLLRKLNYSHNYRTTIFGLPRWTTFSNTDISFFHNLQYEYYTSFYADYNKPVTRNFVLKMRENFRTEPGTHSFSSQGYSYAFLGYDVTFYFLNALAKFGKNFENCLPSYHVDLIQSDFHFSPTENGNGTMNKVVNIVRYNRDFTISKIY